MKKLEKYVGIYENNCKNTKKTIANMTLKGRKQLHVFQHIIISSSFLSFFPKVLIASIFSQICLCHFQHFCIVLMYSAICVIFAIGLYL